MTNYMRGITGDADDIAERDEAFGNNKKPVIEPKVYHTILIIIELL